MNPFKTLWRWACRWWTGREFWEPTGPRPGEPLSEWLKKFRRDGKLVYMKCVNEPAAQLIELVKSPPDVMERTQDLAGRQLAALAPLFRHPTPEVAAQQPASASDFIDSNATWTMHARVNDGSGWRTISKAVNSGDTVKIKFANSSGTTFGLNPDTGELDPIAHDSTQNGVTKIELVEGPALEAEKAAQAAWNDAFANAIHNHAAVAHLLDDIAEGDTIKAVDCGTKPSDGSDMLIAPGLADPGYGREVMRGEKVEGVTSALDVGRFVYFNIDFYRPPSLTKNRQDERPWAIVTRFVKEGIADIVVLRSADSTTPREP